MAGGGGAAGFGAAASVGAAILISIYNIECHENKRTKLFK